MKNLIAGEWRGGSQESGNFNPWNMEIIDQSAQASLQDLEDATQAALKAFQTTRRRPHWQRAEILHRIAALLKEAKDQLSDCMTQEFGRPHDFNANEVDRACFTFTNAAEEAKRLNGEFIPLDLSAATEQRSAYWKREAIGPVLAISPFNFPLNLLAHKVGPAIAAGCSMTIKAAPQTPNTARLLGEIMQKAGSIDGEVNIMDASSEVFEAAVRDDRYKLLSFTGSPSVGWHLKSICGKKKVLLELGNASAAIVHHDAKKLDWIVDRLRMGAFASAGQVCISVQRIFVHDAIADDFEARFAKACAELKPENPETQGALIGPMVDEKAAHRVEAWAQEAISKGAEILAGEQRREGNRLWPLVLKKVPSGSKIDCEEVFGPIVMIERYTDLDQALARANDTPFGLQIAVFTDSLSVSQRVIDQSDVAGVVINDFPTFRIDHMPYGGIKDSGLGREGAKYALEEYTEKKLVITHENFSE